VVESGKVIGQEMHDVRGVGRKLWKLSNEMSIMPGIEAVSWVDDQAKDVEDVVTVPGIGDLHEYVTDRAECMKQPEGAEIFAATLIHPESAVPTIEKQGQAVYRLTTVDLSKTLVLWKSGRAAGDFVRAGFVRRRSDRAPLCPGRCAVAIAPGRHAGNASLSSGLELPGGQCPGHPGAGPAGGRR